MKKILILGANSYIGTSFHNYLSTQYPGEYDVERISLRGDDWKTGKWSAYDSIINVTGKAHADISKLSEEEKQEYYTVNCELAVEAAKKAIADGAAQYIYFSSIIVYGDSSNSRKPVRITSETKPEPDNFYGDSKWQAEQRLRKLFDAAVGNTQLVILRPPMIYGNGSKGNFRMLVKLAEKFPVFPDFPNQRSMLYVENLAEFLRLVTENGVGGLYFPQNEEYVSTAEMVAEIAEIQGKHLHCSRVWNAFVKLAFYIPGKIGGMTRKAFGTLTIDRNMSDYSWKYRKYGLRESIERSLRNNEQL